MSKESSQCRRYPFLFLLFFNITFFFVQIIIPDNDQRGPVQDACLFFYWDKEPTAFWAFDGSPFPPIHPWPVHIHGKISVQFTNNEIKIKEKEGKREKKGIGRLSACVRMVKV